MITLLKHPEVATRSCDECKKFVFDKDGKKIRRRGGGYQTRNGALPPCRLCPKVSPEEAHKFELTTRNYRLYTVYKMIQATKGRYLSDEQMRDPLLAENLAIIYEIQQSRDRGMQAETLMTVLSATR